MTVVLILAFSAFEGVRGRPNGQEERRDGGMSNALKYLEELDKYYSQVARPRYITFSYFLLYYFQFPYRDTFARVYYIELENIDRKSFTLFIYAYPVNC